MTIAQGKTKEKTISPSNPQQDGDSDAKTSRWRVAAFSRYKLWGTDKFSLLVDGSFYYEESSEIYTFKGMSRVIKNSKNDIKIGINMFPAVTYDLNEKLSIKVISSFLSMEVYSVFGKSEYTYDTIIVDGGEYHESLNTKDRANRISFNTAGSLGNIQIGIIYNF